MTSSTHKFGSSLGAPDLHIKTPHPVAIKCENKAFFPVLLQIDGLILHHQLTGPNDHDHIPKLLEISCKIQFDFLEKVRNCLVGRILKSE